MEKLSIASSASSSDPRPRAKSLGRDLRPLLSAERHGGAPERGLAVRRALPCHLPPLGRPLSAGSSAFELPFPLNDCLISISVPKAAESPSKHRLGSQTRKITLSQKIYITNYISTPMGKSVYFLFKLELLSGNPLNFSSLLSFKKKRKKDLSKTNRGDTQHKYILIVYLLHLLHLIKIYFDTNLCIVCSFYTSG